MYQEVNTLGWIDSTYSYGVPTITIIPDDYRLGFQSQAYDWGLYFRGRQAGQGLHARAYGENLQFHYSVLREGFSDSLGNLEDELLFWDYDHPDTFVAYPTTFVSQRFDSIVIQSKTYYDAIEVVTNPRQVAQQTQETIWVRGIGIVRRSMVDGTVWVRNVGIVRKLMTDGTIWNLVRYHINQ